MVIQVFDKLCMLYNKDEMITVEPAGSPGTKSSPGLKKTKSTIDMTSKEVMKYLSFLEVLAHNRINLMCMK